MATAFFDTNGNYYETLTDRDAPEGHTVAPQKPSGDHTWNGSAWVAPSAASILEEERASMICSRFQAKAALAAAGLLEDAETAVAAGSSTAQLAWAEAIEFRRNSPTIATLADAVGLTDAQVDDLFRAAMQIEA